MNDSESPREKKSAIELQEQSLSARSSESVEFADQVTTRQERIDSLGQLQQLAQQRIKQGLELGSKAPGDTSSSEEEDARKFENQDLEHPHAAGGRVQDTDQTIGSIEDEEELHLESGQGDTRIVPPKWIGNIRCYWHNSKGVPRLTIGPNWVFTFFLGAIVVAVLWLSLSALHSMIMQEAAWYYIFFGCLIVLFGLWAFFMTLLSDPGIPKEIYEMKARPYMKRPWMRPFNEKGDSLCKTCQVYGDSSREHCELCNVCIDNLDHHCVFYSKCIGGGNVIYFRLSLIGFILNMTYFVIVYGLISMGHAKKGHHSSKLNIRDDNKAPFDGNSQPALPGQDLGNGLL